MKDDKPKFHITTQRKRVEEDGVEQSKTERTRRDETRRDEKRREERGETNWNSKN